MKEILNEHLKNIYQLWLIRNEVMIEWELKNEITAEIKKNVKYEYLKLSDYYLLLKSKLETIVSTTVARTVMYNENYFSKIFSLFFKNKCNGDCYGEDLLIKSFTFTMVG